MPFKSGADKGDENTSTKLTKSVKVNVFEKDRNTIRSNGRLDDNFINESQDILKKQFLNIDGWQDTLLCQTSFSAVSEESVQIHHTRKINWVCSMPINEHLRVYDSSSSKEWLDLSCELLKLPRRASGSVMSTDRQTLNDFVIVKVLFQIPQLLIIVKKFGNKIELDVVVSTTVKT